MKLTVEFNPDADHNIFTLVTPTGLIYSSYGSLETLMVGIKHVCLGLIDEEIGRTNRELDAVLARQNKLDRLEDEL